jgi:hypothetical protein
MHTVETIVPTFTATIYAGFRVGRSANPTPRIHNLDDAKLVVQNFTDALKDKGYPTGCVSVMPTEFLYGLGNEPGVLVGFINYPRFPEAGEHGAIIRRHAIQLANSLLVGLEQMRVTVVFPDQTVMLTAREGQP